MSTSSSTTSFKVGGRRTKEAILRYHRHPQKTGRFLVTVYDEINVSAADSKHEMRA
jgi:hypothetical protein